MGIWPDAFGITIPEEAMSTRRFLIAVLCAVLLYGSAPYIMGMLTSGAETFTGVHSVAPGDINVYLAMINQAEDHALVFRNIFSTESVAPEMVNPFWLVVGLFGGLFRLTPEWAFHLARLISGALLVLLLWRFVSDFFVERLERRLAFLATVFASGLGVFALLIAPGPLSDPYQRPMDLWVSESSVLLSILHSAHFVVGTLLMVLGFWQTSKAFATQTVRPAVYAGLSFLALFSFHPFHIPTLFLVLGTAVVGEFVLRKFRLRRLLLLAIPALVSFPAALYHLVLQLTNPAVQARADQNINLIPNIASTLLSYGLLLPLAVIGAALWLKKSAQYRFIVWWGLAHFAIIFSPIFFNRRLTQGLEIPIAILASAGLFAVWSWWRERNRNVQLTRHTRLLAAALALFFFGLSPLYVLAQDLSLIVGRQKYENLFYRPAGERAAYRAFEEMSEPRDRFLSGSLTGSFFAAQTSRHAYIAHTVETLSFDRKLTEVRWFFRDASTDERERFLNEKEIQWVVLRKEEFVYSGIIEAIPGLRLLFENSAARIYRVEER